jgi:two-component system, OmpR family, phosphate regulon sensor histidine kinase PhoR
MATQRHPFNLNPGDDFPAHIAQTAARHTPESLVVLDAAGHILHANPAARQLLARPAEQIIGALFVELLDEGSQNKGRALLDAAHLGPTAVYELNMLGGDARVVLVGYRAVPLAPGQLDQTTSEGQVLLIGQMLSTTVATTERLIVLNRRLNALFTLAAGASRSLVLADLLQQAVALTIAELDLQAGAVFLAGAPVEIDSVQLAAQQGFTPAFVDRLPDLRRQPLLAFLGSAGDEPSVSSGAAEDLGLAPEDLLMRTGPLLSVAAVPLRSEDRLVGWLLALSDRYRAFSAGELDTLRTIGNLLGPPVENAHLYSALLETSGQLRAVLDGIDSGVLLIDRAGIVRYANSRLGTLIETDVSHWPGQPRAAVLTDQLRPLVNAAPIFEDELWEVAGPAQRVLRRFSGPISDPSGAPLGTIEVYGDITQVQQMNQLKDDFVAAAAHDLKTPLTAVKGYTQIALRTARRLDQPRLLQQLEMIKARSDELAHLMDTLLDLSHIQAGRLRLEIDTFSIGELVAAVTRHFDFDLQRQQRSIDAELPTQPIEVTWDRARIERVLINLIGNALKYSPTSSPVSLQVRETAPQSGEIEILVTDHGIGIPRAERDRIFERFYRAPQAVQDGFKGSGLGLYICRRVVQAHSGRIWAADALHSGHGTTIHVILPLKMEDRG